MLPAGSYLIWEGGLHGNLIAGAGVRGLVKRRIPRHMPSMIDYLNKIFNQVHNVINECYFHG